MTPLGIARRELGLGVREPEAWLRYCDGDRVAWCAAFLLWCWRGSTWPDLPGNRWRNRAVWYLQRSLEGAGMRITWPQVGDIVVMQRAGTIVEPGAPSILSEGSPGHVGILDHHDLDVVVLIEGNIGDRIVQRRHPYPPKDILAVYRASNSPPGPQRARDTGSGTLTGR